MNSQGSHKTKRQPTERGREKIFANKVTDKRLISRVYRQLMQLYIKKKKNKPNQKKCTEDRNRDFSKEDIRRTKKRMKRSSASLIYQRNANQNHSEVSPHTCQNSHHLKFSKQPWRGCVIEGTLLHCRQECKLAQRL